jgi:hypothetical protein
MSLKNQTVEFLARDPARHSKLDIANNEEK